MSRAQEGGKTSSQTKKNGENEQRLITPPSTKAKKYYPAEDERIPKKVRKSIKPAKPRPTLQPGTVLILVAGRFRGKRVILLKHLSQGVLLITGPFKVNGVPLRRVNARYVIATSTRVGLAGIDEKTLEKVGGEGYFTREKKTAKADEESFFKQGEKPEKKKVASARASDQKAIDKNILKNIKEVPLLFEYLRTSFSLRKGDKPHEMRW